RFSRDCSSDVCSSDLLDAMLDLAVSEELRTSFLTQTFGDDAESWRMRADSWHDPRTIIGASDAGAHLDMIDTFACGTALLGPAETGRASCRGRGAAPG